jgi:hypothetical protein
VYNEDNLLDLALAFEPLAENLLDLALAFEPLAENLLDLALEGFFVVFCNNRHLSFK